MSPLVIFIACLSAFVDADVSHLNIPGGTEAFQLNSDSLPTYGNDLGAFPTSYNAPASGSPYELLHGPQAPTNSYPATQLQQPSAHYDHTQQSSYQESLLQHPLGNAPVQHEQLAAPPQHQQLGAHAQQQATAPSQQQQLAAQQYQHQLAVQQYQQQLAAQQHQQLPAQQHQQHQQQLPPQQHQQQPPAQYYQQQQQQLPPQHHQQAPTAQYYQQQQQIEANTLPIYNDYQGARNYQYSKKPIITKSVYFHAAPEDPEELIPRYIPVGTPQKHLKLIFIKPPTYDKTPIVPVLPENEDKTVVYVLSKKPDYQNVHAAEAPAHEQTKPDVFFVKYRNEAEAQHQQHEIQAAYGTSQNGGGIQDPASLVDVRTVNPGETGITQHQPTQGQDTSQQQAQQQQYYQQQQQQAQEQPQHQAQAQQQPEHHTQAQPHPDHQTQAQQQQYYQQQQAQEQPQHQAQAQQQPQHQ